MTLDMLTCNNVRVFGQGQQALVFAHGFGCDQRMDRTYLGWATFLAQTVVPSIGLQTFVAGFADHRPPTTDHPRVAGRRLSIVRTRNGFPQSCTSDARPEPQIARRFAEATFFSDNRGDLAQLRVPALIMQCSEDQIAPEAVGQCMHHQMPHTTLRVLTANGHCPQMSHPDETIAVIKEYLSRYGPDA